MPKNAANIDWPALLRAAEAARDRAYAPYSNFHVGAALQTLNGQLVLGANIENASLGLTVCAERTAVFTAVNQKCVKFSALAIATTGSLAATPCGACRQVLAEFVDLRSTDLPIQCINEDRKIIETSLSKLLPLSFRL